MMNFPPLLHDILGFWESIFNFDNKNLIDKYYLGYLPLKYGKNMCFWTLLKHKWWCCMIQAAIHGLFIPE